MFPVECVVRGYITGSGWKDYQAHRRGLRDRAAGRPAESEQLPEPIFTPATKAELGDHDENVDFDRAAEIARRPRAARGAAPPVARGLRARRRARARARDHPRRHQVRVRPRADGDDRARRRGAHARLLALLAGRRLRAGPRPAVASTSSTCATGPRARAGTSRRRRPSCPAEVVDAHARALRRGLRAHHGRAVRRLARAERRAVEGAGPDPAQGGDPRPAGPGRRARAARARVRGRRARARRAGWSSSTFDDSRRGSARCASGCSPIR